MRKKYLRGAIIIMLFLMSVLSSCKSPYPQPYGKWQSGDPELILDFNPDPSIGYTGTYVKDGEEIDVAFGTLPYNHLGVSSVETGYGYFAGGYKIKNGKLIYTLNSYWRKELGYKVIEFELIEAYEPPAK